MRNVCIKLKALWFTDYINVLQIKLSESQDPGQDLNDVLSVSREDSPEQDGINKVVSTSRHNIFVDNRGAVWSKGKKIKIRAFKVICPVESFKFLFFTPLISYGSNLKIIHFRRSRTHF